MRALRVPMRRSRSEGFLDGGIVLCLPTAIHRRDVHREVHIAALFLLPHRMRLHGIGDPRLLRKHCECDNVLHGMC